MVTEGKVEDFFVHLRYCEKDAQPGGENQVLLLAGHMRYWRAPTGGWEGPTGTAEEKTPLNVELLPLLTEAQLTEGE